MKEPSGIVTVEDGARAARKLLYAANHGEGTTFTDVEVFSFVEAIGEQLNEIASQETAIGIIK